MSKLALRHQGALAVSPIGFLQKSSPEKKKLTWSASNLEGTVQCTFTRQMKYRNSNDYDLTRDLSGRGTRGGQEPWLKIDCISVGQIIGDKVISQMAWKVRRTYMQCTHLVKWMGLKNHNTLETSGEVCKYCKCTFLADKVNPQAAEE